MAKDPAFLFYPGDWLGGTMGMTIEQKGAYMELLIFQFNNGPFTEAQAKQVLSICFASVWQVVSKKFAYSESSKTFANTRLASEIEKRQKFSESRRKNASSVKAYAKHMENRNENENSINKVSVYGPSDATHFVIVKSRYANEVTARVNGKAGLMAIHEANKTILNLADHADKYMRSRNGKVLNDFSHLQADYNKFIESQFK